MKICLVYIFLLFTLPFTATAQRVIIVHPLSDADVIYGKVAQTREIFYLQPKAGEKIDTAEKRITWYDEDGNTQNMEKLIHTKTGWVPGSDFAIRLTKFGSPPLTTGKDSLEFRIAYDSLGNAVERNNYLADGKLYSKLLINYNPDHTFKKSELYTNGNLFCTTTYLYDQGRLIKEHLLFPNHTGYDVTYKYEGMDLFGNWIKRTRTLHAGLKEYQVQVTERRVIYYE